jgi:threonine dehydrogenase-like Zn-dependent dehydrogenase
VIGVDLVSERLAMAQRHGIDTVDLKAVDDVVDVVRELTGGRGADCGVDAVGMEADSRAVERFLQAARVKPDRLQALWQTGRSIRRGGTLSIIGVYVGVVPMAPIGEVFDRQLTIRLGQANVRRWTDEIVRVALDDADPLALDDLVTHVLPLEQAPQRTRCSRRSTTARSRSSSSRSLPLCGSGCSFSSFCRRRSSR